MVKVFPWNNKHFWLFFPLTTFSVSWLTPLEAVFLDALLPSVVHGLSGFLALHSEGRSLWNQCTYEHNHGNLGWACSRRNFCIQSLGKACFSRDFVSQLAWLQQRCRVGSKVQQNMLPQSLKRTSLFLWWRLHIQHAMGEVLSFKKEASDLSSVRLCSSKYWALQEHKSYHCVWHQMPH